MRIYSTCARFMPMFRRCKLSTICYLLGIILLIEVLFINVAFISMYFSVKNIINEFQGIKGGFMNKLAESTLTKNVISQVKLGGLTSILQNSIDRVYIMPVATTNTTAIHKPVFKNSPLLYALGVDVSNAGEAMFVYKRILSRDTFPYENLVVDIGANDGLISSNSYNFIQWGWRAILVEPQEEQLKLAKANVERYRTSYYTEQQVEYVQAVIGETDGTVKLVLDKTLGSEMTHVLTDKDKDPEKSVVVDMESLTVKTLMVKYKIPHMFGVLSIDAEGQGVTILYQFMTLNLRPAYIIYEALHNTEPAITTIQKLKSYGYQYIIKLGWNLIFEHRPETIVDQH